MTIKDDYKCIGEIKAAAAFIEGADAIIVLAGAGMGVDSGLPDFRGKYGFWREYPQMKEHGLNFENVASPGLFEENPELAWEFYGHREKLYKEKKPHSGYELLKKWSGAMDAGSFVYTSNVDGHFGFAGFDKDRLVECHGNLHRYQCCEPCHYTVWINTPDNYGPGQRDVEYPIQYCPECNRVARPNVMMFDDWDWVRDIAVEQRERLELWLEQIRDDNARVVLMEIGAGTALPAVRRETERLLDRLNARLVRINLREATGPAGTLSIDLPALDALQRIENEFSDEFQKKCIKGPPRKTEKPSTKTVAKRVQNLLFGRPKVKLSTLSDPHLKSLKGRKVYAKLCCITLPNGRKVSVGKFDMVTTHNMIEGLPDRRHLVDSVRNAEDYVWINWGGPRTKTIAPKIFDAHSDRPVLPSMRCAAQLESYSSRNGDEDGSWMNLVWFTDVDSDMTVKDYVSAALAQVDWEKEASAYWI